MATEERICGTPIGWSIINSNKREQPHTNTVVNSQTQKKPDTEEHMPRESICVKFKTRLNESSC